MNSNFEMRGRLVGISGPLLGQKLSLAAEEVSIGRESSNALWAHDQALSRRHCVVIQEQDGFVIRDLDSHNGTLVNGVRIESQQLQHRDQISVGDSVLVFLTSEAAEHPENTPVELTDTAELARPAVRLA
jgi:pSer/pThr/pTyr-binding forkhead associated (FHA) protein